MSDYKRVTGMVSNFETDKIIKAMMKSGQMRVDKVKADAQKLEWKRDGYREVASMLKGFESSFFDLLNRENNMRLSSNYASYKANIRLKGEPSGAVSAKIGHSAKFEKIEISSITSLATHETWQAKRELKEIGGEVNVGDLNLALASGSGSKNLEISVDGRKNTIALESSYNDVIENGSVVKTASQVLQEDLQTKLNAAYGENYVKVNLEGGRLTVDSNAKKVKIESVDSNIGNALSMKTGDTNVFDVSEKLDSLFDSETLQKIFGSSNKAVLKIGNGESPEKEIEITKDMKFQDVISRINGLQGSARLEMDGITGKFKMRAVKSGYANGIVLGDRPTKDFFAALGLSEDVRVKGQNARAIINGEEVVLSSNEVTVEGATITLEKLHNEADGKIEITKSFESKDLVDKMKNFVNKYNELIGKLNTMVGEKTNRKYAPLTDEQRKELKKEEITEWEKKAKEGLFRSDSIINSLLSDLRKAFNSKVDGSDMMISKFGLDFTNNYREGGKLVFDESKFKKAMEENGDKVVSFLTAKSEIQFDRGDQSKRYDENGIMERLNDIFKKATSTTKLRNGKRGSLVEVAGIKGTASEHTSDLSEKIKRINKRADEMVRALTKKENVLYLKFARLERSLGAISSQSNAFSGLMGGSK